MAHSTQPIQRQHVIGYAIGSVGTGGFGVLPGLVLSYYLTDTLGVAALWAGLIVTVPKIWDVAINPFIGNFSDADTTRRGSRRSLMLAGAITLPLFFFLVFSTPWALSPTWAGIWVILTFILATTSFSLFQVPYISLPAELASTPQARTAFVAPRIAVLALAILLFGAGGPLVRDAAGGGHGGYMVMGLVTALGMGGGMIISALLTTPRPRGAATGMGRDFQTAVVNAPRVIRQAIRVVRETSHLPPLLGAFVLQALAAGTMLAAAPYLATYILENESAGSVLFIALVAPALGLMPLARRLADRIGKRQAFRTATVIFAIGAGSLLGLFFHVGSWVYISVALAGVGYAGMQLYPLAMLPDVISADRERTGEDRGGIISGMWTAGETAGMALGPTAALLVLAASGFISSTATTTANQPPSALAGVIFIISALPALLALAGLIPLRSYALTQ